MSSLLSLMIFSIVYSASCHPNSQVKYEENVFNSASDTVHTKFNRSISKCNSDSSPLCHLIKSNQTTSDFKGLVEFTIWLSGKNFSKVKDNGLLRIKRGFLQETLGKVKETFKKMVNRVKHKFSQTLNEMQFLEKVKGFYKNIVSQFNVKNMCSKVKKVNNILRSAPPIDEKINILVAFLEIIFCRMNEQDNENGIRELMENPTYEKLIAEQDSSIGDYQKLMKYIDELSVETDQVTITSNKADKFTHNGCNCHLGTVLIYWYLLGYSVLHYCF